MNDQIITEELYKIKNVKCHSLAIFTVAFNLRNKHRRFPIEWKSPALKDHLIVTRSRYSYAQLKAQSLQPL